MRNLLIAVSFVLLISACQYPENTELPPPTDISDFVFGNTVIFPKAASAWDIYNVIYYLYPDGGYHDVIDGEIINNNNTSYFNRIRHIHNIDSSGLNTKAVYFYLNSSQPPVLSYSFHWREINNQITISMPLTREKIVFLIE
ncbi:MAG: hypothetical protein LBU66_05605 [Treponema sp.]|nr:hypothetical protein [Treponema sp.]